MTVKLALLRFLEGRSNLGRDSAFYRYQVETTATSGGAVTFYVVF